MKKSKMAFITTILALTSCSQLEKKPARTLIDHPKGSEAYEISSCDEMYAPWGKDYRDVNALFTRKSKRRPASKYKSPDDLYALAKTKECPDLTPEELDDLLGTAEYLDGHVPHPKNFENTPSGLQDFLDEAGVSEKFSSREMVTPNDSNAAKTCGHKILLPPQCRWPSGAVQAHLARELRAVINNGDADGPEGITLRNWYRPNCYNKKVGGAGASDHIQARGFDLDFKTPKQRAKAQKYLCDLYKKERLNLQVGVGCLTLHVGMGSPKRLENYPEDGPRYWTYASLQSCELKRIEGDDCWQIDQSGKRYIHTSDKIIVSGGL